MAAPTIRIPARFNGPPGSANGGYACGVVASLLGAGPAEVTLRTPPPLERELLARRDGPRVTVLGENGVVVAEARPTELDLAVPEAPSVEVATDASRAGYRRWSAEHPFPRCVVCGPDRAPGDGMRIFPGTLADGRLFACAWTPHESVTGAAGAVLPECVWAALDCPTSAPVANFGEGPPAVLGRLTAGIEESVRAEEPHVIVSWAIERDGRKRTAGAALYDSRGRVLARSRATWIVLREPPSPATQATPAW